MDFLECDARGTMLSRDLLQEDAVRELLDEYHVVIIRNDVLPDDFFLPHVRQNERASDDEISRECRHMFWHHDVAGWRSPDPHVYYASFLHSYALRTSRTVFSPRKQALDCIVEMLDRFIPDDWEVPDDLSVEAFRRYCDNGPTNVFDYLCYGRDLLPRYDQLSLADGIFTFTSTTTFQEMIRDDGSFRETWETYLRSGNVLEIEYLPGTSVLFRNDLDIVHGRNTPDDLKPQGISDAYTVDFRQAS